MHPHLAPLLGVVSLAGVVLAISPGQLGIQLNPELAVKNLYVFNSRAQFQEDILENWTNEQIAGISQRAYQEMAALVEASKTSGKKADYKDPYDLKKYGFQGFSMPTVMTVVVKGHSAFISSSLKGGGSLVYLPNGGKNKWTPGVINQGAPNIAVLAQALTACQLGSITSSGHQRGGNCGEPMAVMAYLQDFPTGDLTGGKVVTWGKFLDANGQQIEGVMNPCATDRGTAVGVADWGCGQTMPLLGLTVIPRGTEAHDTPLAYNPTLTHPCYQ